MRKKEVIIVGAGPAGLTAGYQLLKKSNKYHVIILEASNDIGGISKTVNYNGYRMDIGGHRFFSKNDDVMSFWQDVMPIEGTIPFDYRETGRKTKITIGGPNPDKEDNVMLVRNRISRIYYLKHFFYYPISLS